MHSQRYERNIVLEDEIQESKSGESVLIPAPFSRKNGRWLVDWTKYNRRNPAIEEVGRWSRRYSHSSWAYVNGWDLSLTGALGPFVSGPIKAIYFKIPQKRRRKRGLRNS